MAQTENDIELKPIAKMWFVHDLEDGWYRMETPHGKLYDWNNFNDALEFCNKRGWTLTWVSKGFPQDFYKPAYFKNQQMELPLSYSDTY